MNEITVISWDIDDAEEDAEQFGWWGGFFEEGMRWKDYIEEFDDDIIPYLEAARESAVKNKIMVKGGQHQSFGITPVFSDGKYFALTLRAWGDFMAAVWSEKKNKDYSYLYFYP